MGTDRPLVSVVVPFLNAERFMQETIGSVFAQKYDRWELLLVDDGSSDGSSRIARRYAEAHPDRVRYLEHPGHANHGISASRNLGLREARGELIAPLDADDVWLPEKLEQQVAIMQAHPAVGMVYGRSLFWSSWNADAPPNEPDYLIRYAAPLSRTLDPPLVLLQSYPLRVGGGAPPPSDLLLRREVVERLGGSEESFTGPLQLYEDQPLLAKMYLSRPVYIADECWTWYRLHPSSVVATVTESGQYDSVRRHFLQWLADYLEREGIRDRRVWYAVRRALEPYEHPRRARLRQWAQGPAKQMVEKNGRWVVKLAKKARSRTSRLIGRGASPGIPAAGEVAFGDLRRVTPLESHWGWTRGMPVDRYYVEEFLSRHAGDIRGRVLEVGDNHYTRKFGGARVTRSEVLHVAEGNPNATIVADLSNAEHIPSDAFDCIILTQTLQFIYDVRAAMATLQRILKPGGVLLLTVPGISKMMDRSLPDSWFWLFTDVSLRRLAGEAFPTGSFQIASHGNVLAAISFLHGLAHQELEPKELDVHDRGFAVLITLRAAKPAVEA